MMVAIPGSRITVLTVVIGAALLGSTASQAIPRKACASGSGTTVGTLSRILSTSVFVAKNSIGAAPCDLLARSEIRTDERGQAIFKLSSGGRDTKCILLPRSSVVLSPELNDQQPIVRFTNGRAWCSTKAGKSGFFSPRKLSRGRDIKLITGSSTFGVTFGARATEPTLVKVESSRERGGVMITDFRNITHRLKSRQQVTVDSSGHVGKAMNAKIDVADRLALAQLGAAP
jgi:hypothetical protein